MNAAIQASGLGKQYRRAWALRDCTLAIPEGRVAGLVGPNGAGKTTLLRLAAGMLTPTRGTITVLGQRPGAGPAQLARVGFVAQDTPIYSRMTVTDHLRLVKPVSLEDLVLAYMSRARNDGPASPQRLKVVS
jgi:ABC-2 type transport system ATP-binding protein